MYVSTVALDQKPVIAPLFIHPDRPFGWEPGMLGNRNLRSVVMAAAAALTAILSTVSTVLASSGGGHSP